MKIVHIQLHAPYTDNWGYQENILPRCQVRAGDEVTVIAQNEKHVPTGEIIETNCGTYKLDDGVTVIRIAPKNYFVFKKINRYLGTYSYIGLLKKLNPDVVFIHGLYTSIFSAGQIVRYKKKYNKKCVVICDTHEWGYGVRGFEIKEKMTARDRFERLLGRISVKRVLVVCEHVLCLAPICKSFANRYYLVPESKMLEFPLGFDPMMCNIENREEIRTKFRKKIGIDEDDIVIIHGGKIIPRRNTDKAILAVKKAKKNRNNVKLVIFGAIQEEIASEIMSLIQENSSFVIYLGHLHQRDYCDAFLSSDIAFFPGVSSSLWEEAIGCGLPLVITKDLGAEILDRGGNVIFCKKNDLDSYAEGLEKVLDNKKWIEMGNVAVNVARSFFSYEEMAKKIRSFAGEVDERKN